MIVKGPSIGNYTILRNYKTMTATKIERICQRKAKKPYMTSR